MKKLCLFISAFVLLQSNAYSQITLKDKDGKEYIMEVAYDDPEVCPKYVVHVFQPAVLISETAAFFAPNLGFELNPNAKLKLSLDLAPSIGGSNVAIERLPDELQGGAQWANYHDISASYLLKRKLVEKTKTVQIGGGGYLVITTKMPIHKLKGIALRGSYQGLNTTPSLSKVVSVDNDFLNYVLTNRKVSSLTIGPSFNSRIAYQVSLDGRSFVGYRQTEIFFQMGLGLQNAYEIYEGSEGIGFERQDKSVTDPLVQEASGLAWKAGMRLVNYRPEAKLCKYFYANVEFGSMPATAFESDKAGFFRFAFGYAFGKDIAR